MSDAVSRIVERFGAMMAAWGRDTTLATMRADWDAFFSARGAARSTPVVADGVPCEWIAAEGVRTDRAILFCHGGGFQVGSIASHHELAARLSAAAAVPVLSVGYRLAPEHRFPAALDDACTAWRWLLAQGFAARQVALAGDSAGGGLVLSLMLWLQARGLPQPAAAWGLSAWTDLAASGSSYTTRAAVDPINQRPKILAMARICLGRDGNADDPLASPARAGAAQLAGLPPLLLHVGDREVVLSDSQDLADRARSAGVPVTLRVWPGMFHVFQQFAAELPEARESIAEGGRFLAGHLA